jgi:Uma2 family endonuclease
MMIRIGSLLLSQIDQTAFQVCGADLGVKTKAGVRYPDIVVDVLRPSEGKSLAASAPVFIAEILSPSSISIDMIEKAAEYMALDSLKAYAVFSQDEPKAWIWSRTSGAWAEEPDTVDGWDASIEISALSAVLPLRSIFQGIGSAPSS